jgi:hypothetical protein
MDGKGEKADKRCRKADKKKCFEIWRVFYHIKKGNRDKEMRNGRQRFKKWKNVKKNCSSVVLL